MLKDFLKAKSLQISAFATPRNTILVFVVFLVFQVVLGYLMAQMQAEVPNIGVLDLAFGYSGTTAYTDYLDKYTDTVRALCVQAECVDLLYPWAYGLLLACLMSFVLQKTKFYYLNTLPFFAVALDYVENAGIFTLLLSHPSKLYMVASMTSVFGSLKWLFVGVAALVLLIGFIVKMFNLISK